MNSFHPLCRTEIGRKAVETFGFPPFIDGSCRREPDFENPFPSITALCRQAKFAPHLYPGDIVVYTTVKGKWYTGSKHYRIVAILEVIERKDTHLQAKKWYQSKGIRLPSNCMVDYNPPFPFHATASLYKTNSDVDNFLSREPDQQEIIGAKIVSHWDGEYLVKAKEWSCFIICRPVFINLKDPPVFSELDVRRIFRKSINTRMPKILNMEEYQEILKLVNSEHRLSD